MKQFKKLVLLLVLVMLSIACEHKSDNAINQNFTTVTTEEARSLIDKNKGNQNFAIIDLRTPQEINYGFLKDALFLDYMVSDFQQDLEQLDRNKTYLIYCQSGYRSNKTFDLMKSAGFKTVYSMQAGFVDWYRKGYPVEFR